MFIILYLYLFLIPVFTKSFSTNIYNFGNKIVNNKNLFMNNNNHNNINNANINNDKKYFLQLLDYNLELTKKLDLTPVKIEEPYEKLNTTDNSGVLYNYCYSNDKFRKVRFTYFDGDSQYQYFSIVIHPIYNYDIPIFNFEVILYNDEKIVYTLNMVKMAKSNIYNEKYVKPFMRIKNKYPELKENIAVRMSGYTIMGNYISEAILLGKFVHKSKDTGELLKLTDEVYMKENIYEKIIMPSFTKYLTTYLDFFDCPIFIHITEEVENIKNRHRIFDMKKAFVESKYDIRKCFDEKTYRNMLYNFFYKLETDSL